MAVTSPADKLADFWNRRYGKEEFAYGTAPNDFRVEFANRIPPRGSVLCLADGEGRNGVWLATQGHAVTSVDIAGEGMTKASRLAAGGCKRLRLQPEPASKPGETLWPVIPGVLISSLRCSRRPPHRHRHCRETGLLPRPPAGQAGRPSAGPAAGRAARPACGRPWRARPWRS